MSLKKERSKSSLFFLLGSFTLGTVGVTYGTLKVLSSASEWLEKTTQSRKVEISFPTQKKTKNSTSVVVVAPGKVVPIKAEKKEIVVRRKPLKKSNKKVVKAAPVQTQPDVAPKKKIAQQTVRPTIQSKSQLENEPKNIKDEMAIMRGLHRYLKKNFKVAVNTHRTMNTQLARVDKKYRKSISNPNPIQKSVQVVQASVKVVQPVVAKTKMKAQPRLETKSEIKLKVKPEVKIEETLSTQIVTSASSLKKVDQTKKDLVVVDPAPITKLAPLKRTPQKVISTEIVAKVTKTTKVDTQSSKVIVKSIPKEASEQMNTQELDADRNSKKVTIKSLEPVALEKIEPLQESKSNEYSNEYSKPAPVLAWSFDTREKPQRVETESGLIIQKIPQKAPEAVIAKEKKTETVAQAAPETSKSTQEPSILNTFLNTIVAKVNRQLTEREEKLQDKISVVQSAQKKDSVKVETNKSITTPISASYNKEEVSEKFYEAFDLSVSVKDVEVEVISYGGKAREDGAHWVLASSDGYWSTLAWGRQQSIPLISETNLSVIEGLAQTTTQPRAGIVFGEVADGWSVEFSGRADHLLAFDSDMNLLEENELESMRYFTYLNAEPGAHLLNVEHSSTQAKGSVPIAVFGGVATYVAIQKSTNIEITGKVLDASQFQALGTKGIHVQVVGQESKNSISNHLGEFVLHDITLIDEYPLYLETESNFGYKHRYQFEVKSLEHKINLYRFNTKNIEEWVSQLKGGVSEESGLVIGALPGLVREHTPDSLYASVFTLEEETTLDPETYTLSHDGYLNTHQPLTQESSRFVGVQVPEGPVLAKIYKVEGNGEKEVWSHMIFSSPGVVNIINPD